MSLLMKFYFIVSNGVHDVTSFKMFKWRNNKFITWHDVYY
jgi:hypothetical protein